MLTQFSRTQLCFGREGMERLKNAHVAVFGIGGVGGHAVDALARSGIGALTLVDNDAVSESNLNRQMIATRDTIGQPKVEAAAAHIRSIHPECRTTPLQRFFLPENAQEFDFSQFDYIVDAIDTVSGKIALAEQAQLHAIPIISSMGAGNKLDPTAFRVTDIYKTAVCPLAKVMRHELKKHGIRKLKVVYSEELPLVPDAQDMAEVMALEGNDSQKRRIPASNAFVPSVVGLIIAGEVVKDIAGVRERKG